MLLNARPYHNEDDYWRIRNFLRAVFLLNERSEHSWPVARLDHWRFHLIDNCHLCGPVEEVITIWETAVGQIAAVINPVSPGEIRLHVHPHFRSMELEDDMLSVAEQRLSVVNAQGQRVVYLPVDADDELRQTTLLGRGFSKRKGRSRKWLRDLNAPIPETPLPPGYSIRSMGDSSEHPARSWASWRAFHSDEPDENYDGDWTWLQNVQAAPLYRRDLDIVAAAPSGEIVAFCTIFYDDYTRSAVCVIVGTMAAHQRRGLGKAVMFEGFRRLQKMGCLRVFATAYDLPADALYGSVMTDHVVSETWRKEFALG